MKLGVIILSVLAFSCLCRAGTVHTRDGRDLTGDLRLESTVVVVHPPGGDDVRLTLADISDVDFTQKMATPAADAPGEGGQGGLKAEYFTGISFDASKRKVLRLDPVIDFTWKFNRDALFMVNDRDWIPFCVRWTGQIRPLFSETYTLRMRSPSPDAGEIHAKLWIDGKQVIADGVDSGEVMLQAGHLHELKIDLIATKNDRRGKSTAVRLTWESQSQPRQVVPANCLYISPTMKDLPILARILSPANNTIASSADDLLIDAQVEPGVRKIDHVELWAGSQLLQTYQSPPYEYTWKNAPPGDYNLHLVAVAKDGLKSSSGPVRVLVTDTDGGKISSPWGRFNIGGQNEKVTVAEKKITLVRTGGELYALKDKCQFLYQVLVGDGEIVAKLDGVAPDTAAGLMIRRSLAEDSLDCGVLFQPGAGVVSLRRLIEKKSSINSASAAVSPGYMKLAREGQIIRLYRSDDGVIWQFVDQQELELPDTVLIGAVVSCQAAGTASASFEDISVTANHAVQSIVVPGLLLRDGSIINGEIISVDKTSVTLERGEQNNRKRITATMTDVARINIHPPDGPSADAEDPGWHGVVLSHGDIYEGDVRVLDRRGVQVNSDVLGRRQFNAERDLSAVVLGAATPSAAPYELALADGSILHSSNVEIIDGGVVIDTPFAKGFHVDLKELSRLKAHP